MTEHHPPDDTNGNAPRRDRAHGIARAVAAVHAAGVLVVDLSDVNVLVETSSLRPALIDCDSWQTPGHPATAITPAITDPLAAGCWSEGSDWFSFAVLAFSLLTGIHPFRGKHPTVKGLPARMKAGISVFDPAVRLPRACLPVASIPNPWRDWLHATLHQGRRTPPPMGGGGLRLGTRTAPRAVAAALRMHELSRAAHDVRAVLESRGRLVIHAGSEVQVDGEVRLTTTVPVALAMSTGGHPVVAWIDAGRLHLYDLDRGRTIACQAAARQLCSVRGTLYVACGETIARVELLDVGRTLVAGLRPCVQVAPNASRLWRGCVIQQLLGTTTVSLLSGSGAAQVRVAALDGLHIVDAVADRDVMVVVARRGPEYVRLVLRLSSGHAQVLHRCGDQPAHAAQLVTLDTGVCVSLDAEEHLQLFVRDPARSTVRTLEDPAIGGDWLLYPGDGRLLVAAGPRLYEVSMRRRS